MLSWELSNTVDTECCPLAVAALEQFSPAGVFDADQGSQFTSQAFTGCLQEARGGFRWTARAASWIMRSSPVRLRLVCGMS